MSYVIYNADANQYLESTSNDWYKSSTVNEETVKTIGYSPFPQYAKAFVFRKDAQDMVDKLLKHTKIKFEVRKYG